MQDYVFIAGIFVVTMPVPVGWIEMDLYVTEARAPVVEAEDGILDIGAWSRRAPSRIDDLDRPAQIICQAFDRVAGLEPVALKICFCPVTIATGYRFRLRHGAHPALTRVYRRRVDRTEAGHGTNCRPTPPRARHPPRALCPKRASPPYSWAEASPLIPDPPRQFRPPD